MESKLAVPHFVYIISCHQGHTQWDYGPATQTTMLEQTPYEEAIIGVECRELAAQLGIENYPEDDRMKPFMRYVSLECKATEYLPAFYSLLARTVHYFDNDGNPSAAMETLSSYILSLSQSTSEPYFDTKARTLPREYQVTHTVFLCLGLWTMMKTNFVPSLNSPRPVSLAYLARTGRSCLSPEDFKDPVDTTLRELIIQSGLIPSVKSLNHDFDAIQDALVACDSDPNAQFTVEAVESLYVRTEALNLSKLCTLAGVQIHWTNNLSRHLLLSQRAGLWLVELYALPCTLEQGFGRKLKAVGIPGDYLWEIQQSYASLFNPVTPSELHRVFDWLLKPVCWCLYCSSRCLRKQEFSKIESGHTGMFYDPTLETLSSNEKQQWDQISYRHLWPRVLKLESHLQNAKPWNFWVLFRDRREKMPFWTFL